ncbi:unnamed protein product, partial [marine sediment metagenome]
NAEEKSHGKFLCVPPRPLRFHTFVFGTHLRFLWLSNFEAA